MDVNRHVKWPYWPVEVQVRESTEVEKGDLIFLDEVNNLRNNGSSTANHSAYPFSKLSGASGTLANNQYLAAYHFLGVAMEGSYGPSGSEAGVTQNIAVATTGHFSFPLKSPKSFKVASVVMPSGSGVTLFDQKVMMWESGSTYPLGYVTEGRTRGVSVTLLLRTGPCGHGRRIS